MKVAVSSPRRGRISNLAGLCALVAATAGCHRNAQIATKSPVPVRLAEVALYESPEGLRYSASIVPFAQASLSFKSSGYITNIRQLVMLREAKHLIFYFLFNIFAQQKY